MTCIAGYLHDDGGVTLMADTVASTDNLLIACEPHKLFRSGPALVGVSGGIRVNQIIRYLAPPFLLGEDGPVPSLLRWIDDIRPRCVGAIKSKDGIEDTESRLLVAVSGRLFEIDSEWQVIEPVSRFWATGSGQRYALAALRALEHAGSSHEPADRLRIALRIAAEYDPYVGGPFETLSAGSAAAPTP